MNPTYLIAVGPFGAAVLARLQADLAAAPASIVMKYFPLPEDPGQRPAEQMLTSFAERVAIDLHAQLRDNVTQVESSGGSRLDLIVVADLDEAGGSLLGAVLQALSATLRQDFAVMFPPGTPPAQRSVWLVLALATGSLDDTPAGLRARAALAALERWHMDGPPTPILSRIYLLPQQNEGMPLSRQDLERGVYLFIATAYLSGLRETEPIRSRLEPPRNPSCLLATFSVAAIDVEVDKMLAAFAWRSAIAALEQLVAQCEATASPERVLAMADGIALDVACGELMAIGLNPRGAAGSLSSRLAAADRAEAEALLQARRTVRELVDLHLSGGDGLKGFQLATKCLALAAERLVRSGEELARDWLPDARLVMAVTPEAGVLDAVMTPPPSAASPRFGAMLPLGSLLGAVVGVAVTATAAAIMARNAAGAGGPTVAGPALLDPTAGRWGLLAAVAATVGWLALAAWFQRQRVAQTAIVHAPKPQPRTASVATAEDDLALAAALTLRKRRVARGILRFLADERQRLDALRAAVLDALSHARERLRGLGVKQGEHPAQDDYSMLLSADAPLHRMLLPAATLPQLWERNRAIRDDQLWASDLLQRAWPAGGIGEDLPFGPGEAWESVLAHQHQSLRERGVFAWPDLGAVLAEQLGRFLRTVPRALKFGVHCHRPDGSPVAMSHAQELLVVVPTDGRALVERLLREHTLPDASLLSSKPHLSRVLVLRTAAEFDAASLEPLRR